MLDTPAPCFDDFPPYNFKPECILLDDYPLTSYSAFELAHKVGILPYFVIQAAQERIIPELYKDHIPALNKAFKRGLPNRSWSQLDDEHNVHSDFMRHIAHMSSVVQQTFSEIAAAREFNATHGTLTPGYVDPFRFGGKVYGYIWEDTTLALIEALKNSKVRTPWWVDLKMHSDAVVKGILVDFTTVRKPEALSSKVQCGKGYYSTIFTPNTRQNRVPSGILNELILETVSDPIMIGAGILKVPKNYLRFKKEDIESAMYDSVSETLRLIRPLYADLPTNRKALNDLCSYLIGPAEYERLLKTRDTNVSGKKRWFF